MDLRQIRYFLAITEAGSITGAAEKLDVAQPALSLHVKSMEDHLDTQLLIRRKTGVTPTEAGTMLMRRARAILDDFARMEDDIRTLDADPMGEVRIGLPGTISNIVALPLIEAARTRFPRIRLNIAEAMSGFIADWMDEGRIDLAVLYEPSRSEGIISDLLLEEELVVLWFGDKNCPPEISLTGLRDIPLILPSRSHGLRTLIDRAFVAKGIAAQVAIEIDSYTNIKRLVAAGYGASILPTHAVLDEARTAELAFSRFAAPGLWRGAWLVHPSGRPATRAKEAILSLTTEIVRSLIADGTWAAAHPTQSDL